MLKREDLHEYQNYAINFVETHPESLLILQMGLGKTAVGLTAIADLMFDSFEVSKTLVIAPLRVCTSVWPVESQNWEHTRFLKMSVVCGSEKDRKAALERDADVYVVNRENVKWLTDFYRKRRCRWPFDFVIIDELSSFKNHKAQRFKALRSVRPKVKRITGLTGSPGSLMDLWAEVGILDQGKRLGRFIGRYREAYFKPGSMNPYTGVVFNYMPRPGAENQIYKRIEDMTISMKSIDFLDMPEKVEVNHFVDMDRHESDLYQQMLKDLVVDIDDEEITAANAAVLSGKLLQMASGALKVGDDSFVAIHNRKLKMLNDLIEEANGEPVLIVYWFRHNHERITTYLKEKGYPVRDIKTDDDIADWNAGKIPIALINPASAGHGLNIQKGGHILIWFDLVWSLELYQQTCARLYRQGQKETVSIHHILCKGTIDEKVLDALKGKDTSQEKLIDAVKAIIK